MKYIPISCLCLTYGRTKLLEESIQSFLNYDYEGDYEMVIINDFPKQRLYYHHSKIRIINLDKTFSKWGEKEDFGIKQCSYDTVVQHDDDDIGFPWLLKTINKYFYHGCALLHWNRAAYWSGHSLVEIRAVGNSGIVFSKKACEKIGGYPHENCGADTTFVRTIAKAGLNIVRAFPADSDVAWNYRWGMPNYNCSGQGSDKDRPEEEQIISRHCDFVAAQVAKGVEPIGEITLNPHWDIDYVQKLKEYNEKTPEQRRINHYNLNGWAIGEEVLNWILSRVPKGSTILEFGSGRGTIELSRFYDVISVEHNPKWIGLSKTATYVHAPLVDGWYDTGPVEKAILGKDIKVIIIDGPPGAGNREGFIKNFHLFSKLSSMIVDDTHRPQELALAQKISKLVHRKNITITGHEKKFDVI